MVSVWLIAAFLSAAAAGGGSEERPDVWGSDFAALDGWANWFVLGNGFDDAEWYEEEENATVPSGGGGAWEWSGAGDEDDDPLDGGDDGSTSLCPAVLCPAVTHSF